MLLWVKPGMTPNNTIMAEVPRPQKVDEEHLQEVGTYLRKVVLKMQMHGQCKPNWCYKDAFGKQLSYCKYGFPFKVPQLTEELDEDNVGYIYVHRQHEDRMVVPYNPEIALLWDASHNLQHVSKHGFEQYLAKYISKAEPSCNIQLPENASLPQRYLHAHVWGGGSIEAVEVLMGFHQSQMTRHVTFLRTELTPAQCMLKHSTDLQHLQDDSQDVYTTTRFETYLLRSPQLTSITYPEYYQWLRPAASSEQRKAESAAARGKTHSVNPRCNDDFAAYLCPKSVLEDAQLELVYRLEECDMAINTMDELLAVL